jgi:hypothetical protein
MSAEATFDDIKKDNAGKPTSASGQSTFPSHFDFLTSKETSPFLVDTVTEGPDESNVLSKVES